REDSVVPVRTDAAHRRDEDLLGDRRHRRAIAGEAVDEITHGPLVSADQRVVRALRKVREAGAGLARAARCWAGALSGEPLDVGRIDAVAAANALRPQT